jgi:hypothetical protein
MWIRITNHNLKSCNLPSVMNCELTLIVHLFRAWALPAISDEEEEAMAFRLIQHFLRSVSEGLSDEWT